MNHFEIFDYWKDKAICKDGHVITESEASLLGYEGTIPVIKDWGEPSCWACGKRAGEDAFIETGSYSKIWNDKSVVSKLNKCHILAKQFNGSDEPDNLFLICERCHCESPDTLNRDAFMRWIFDRRKSWVLGMDTDILNKVTKEMERRGYSLEKTAASYSKLHISADDILREMHNKIGLHGSKTSSSSIIIGYVDALEETISKKSLEDLKSNT